MGQKSDFNFSKNNVGKQAFVEIHQLKTQIDILMYIYTESKPHSSHPENIESLHTLSPGKPVFPLKPG